MAKQCFWKGLYEKDKGLNIEGCMDCTGMDTECPSYYVSGTIEDDYKEDVELAEPHGESTGLERLFGAMKGLGNKFRRHSKDN